MTREEGIKERAVRLAKAVDLRISKRRQPAALRMAAQVLMNEANDREVKLRVKGLEPRGLRD